MQKQFRLIRLSIFTIFTIGLFVVGSTYAFYQDDATSEDNSMDAISLDMEFDSDSDSFEPDEEFYPGTVLNRVGYVKNNGQLPFIYSQEFQFISGEQDLCSELNLRVTYEYEDDGEAEEIEKYDGDLVDFEITGAEDEDLQHPNDSSDDNPHKYNYEITVPLDLDEDLADKSCNFNILGSAWMEGFSVGEAYWDQEVLSQGLTTKEYDDPISCEVGELIFQIGDIEDSDRKSVV